MQEVVGIRFKSVGKIYYFDPNGLDLSPGDSVIVETSRGIECGQVAIPAKHISEEEWTQPIKKVLRLSTDQDQMQVKTNQGKAKFAYQICLEKIKKHQLDMKLIDVEYTLDGSKVLFYFTADGRVDFRELVKDLAAVLKTRIELRQIGVRDEAKMLGGLGICGRAFCCSTFLGEFQPVSIKMAKEQGLSLNPTKISGTCGRLMCCLKYEQNAYEDLMRTMPRQGATVQTPQGRGYISDISLLTGYVKVVLEKNSMATPFHKSEIRVIRTQSDSSGKSPQNKNKPISVSQPPSDRQSPD